jgi:hypothetical protein
LVVGFLPDKVLVVEKECVVKNRVPVAAPDPDLKEVKTPSIDDYLN